MVLSWMIGVATAAPDRDDDDERRRPPRAARMDREPEYRNVITVGPRLLPPGIGGRYMRSFSDDVTGMIGAGYGGFAIGGVDFGVGIERWDLRAGLDLEPQGEGLRGVYVGPRLVYRHFTAQAGSAENAVASQTMGLGAVVGFRWIWDPGFTLGGGVGLSYDVFLAGRGNLDDDDEIRLRGLTPVVEVTIGWAF
jgi:hypothetical protein